MRLHLALASCIAFATLPAAAQTYKITDLGTLGGGFSQANATGGWGQVVGLSENADGEYHAFLYSGRTLTDLGTFGGELSAAVAINSASQIAGYYYDHGYKGFLLADGMELLGPAPPGDAAATRRSARSPLPRAGGR